MFETFKTYLCLLGLVLSLMVLIPSNTYAQDREYEEHPWNINIGMGVSLYEILPMPSIELSVMYRINDFYRVGVHFNSVYLHNYTSKMSRRIQYQALFMNSFDFYKGRRATWSAKIGLGYMYLFYKMQFLGDLGDNEYAAKEYYESLKDIHSFSTLLSVVFDYRLTDHFSLGFSMPITINFNKYHRYFGGFNLLLNMGFHFGAMP